ncbi:phage tail-collar fiber domain-containing protein [Kosakonia sacchari]
MSQTAITTAFEQWKARQNISNEAVTLDEFVFALVPGLDVSLPVDRAEALPPAAQIVHRQAVSRTGMVNENAVVFSVVLGADVGDFSFNWIGLINKASGTLAMVVHAPEQQKIRTAAGKQGNVLTRSFLMEFNGAQTETGINTPAETWQIDFTARMAGMDERQRLENIDIYGAAAFFHDGYLVGKSGSQYFVTRGAGYVAGLRSQLAANENIAVTTKPVKVWLDVSWTGSLTSTWAVKSNITVAATLADYVQNGVPHYVFALASIDASGNITDLRPKGTLNDQTASDALKRHAQSRNHPDATTTEKGFTRLSSATDSLSETEAATPKAVKAANDNANGRVPVARTVNGHALSADISVTAQDIFNGQAVEIGYGADLNSYTTPGLYFQSAIAFAQSGANYPEVTAGSLEIYKHAGITQVYRVYNASRSYTRTFYNGVWTAWVQNIDSTGGKVAWLEGATYYKTSPAGWYGAGAFANQYVNNAAPFLMPSGFASPKDVSNYLPIVKGLVSTEGYGYGAAVSFGALVSGGAAYPSAVLNVACDSGQGGAWIFDPVTRGFSSDGPIATNDQVLAGTNVVATMGVYESGGNVRVYSPNNPPDARYPVQDGVSYVGIASGNEGMPYMRARASGSLIYLARQDWVQTYFLQKGEAEARYNLANTAWKAPVGWEKDSTTGMITQWGVATRAAAGTRINFPIAFPTECVSVQLTLIWQGGFHDRNMYVQPVDNTGFNYVSQTDEVSAYFLAKGY